MSLTSEQLEQFDEQGFLVAENLLEAEDIEPLIHAHERWVDGRARQLQAEGKIRQLHEEAPFKRRFALLYAQSPEMAKGLDLMEARLPESLAFMRNERLLDAVASFIGSEITCSPIQHIRAKPPGEHTPGYDVPWHQDAGVTWEEADNSDIITCWIPLVDASVENGCVQVLPGVSRKGYREHVALAGTTIRPDLLPAVEPRSITIARGGVLFMHRYTPHRSLPNVSDTVRWSLDFRYQPTGTPTGRPFHPAFVARSAAHPETVLTDPAEWSRLWVEALASSHRYHAHRTKQ